MSKAKAGKSDYSEEKLRYFQILSEHLIKENENLKQKLEDMKITAQTNKQMLQEYIDHITDKDKIVQKLQCTIETLAERTKTQDEIIKKIMKENKEYLAIINLNKTKTPSKTEENLDVSRVDSVNSSYTPYTTNMSNYGKMDSKLKELFTKKQNSIFNELNQLKYDFKFIVEKYEELNKLYMKKTREKPYEDLNSSSLNASMISEFSTDTVVIQKKVNLRKKFGNEIKLQNILSKNEEDSLIIFVDGKNCVWELVRREDLTLNSLKFPENIISIKNKKNNRNDSFLNLEVKDINDTSLNTSYIQTGKNDFNISILMKD